MAVKTKKYEDHLRERLQSVEDAKGYLDAAFEDGDRELILLARQDVIKVWSKSLSK